MEAISLEQAEKIDKTVKTAQNTQSQLESRVKALENANRDLLAKVGKFEKRPPEEKKLSPVKDKIHYKVKRGETLRSIAKKFRVSPDDLSRWNKIDKNKFVRLGEILVIYPH